MLPTETDCPLAISRVVLDGNVVTLEPAGLAECAACPGCGAPSGSIHDRSVRWPLDLPYRGRLVRLVVTVRRFRGPTATCPRAGAGWAPASCGSAQ
jgi:hypothetical protein